MPKKKWIKLLPRDKATYTYRHVGNYWLLIGKRRSTKLYEYVAGHAMKSQVMLQMRNMMNKGSDFYLMEIHPCDNTPGAIDDLLHAVNRGRGDETDPKKH